MRPDIPRIAVAGRRTYMHSYTDLHFSRCTMETRVLERRRLLRLVVLGSLAAPAIALAGCATGGGHTRAPRFGGGNSGGKSGNGGGPGAKGSGGGK